MNTILRAIKIVLGTRFYYGMAGLSFLVFLFIYLITLPASSTGGYISVSALKYLTPTLVAFSVVMAALVALLLPLIVYLIRQGRKSSKSSATGGLLVGILAPILCCSPILPITVGFIAGLLPTLGGTFGVNIQKFIATNQTELFLFASLLLAFALYQNAKKVVNGVLCEV